ncbi:putative expressed protein [Lyophyllum shimeji]|uniref:Expressed protein n=1 Tax=Lyophyllum shimeji TaxID=47721 RepID=A0A9P3PM91_LYOSH|nr:putative expressed protein [Lyophyllum shimeji]
MAVVSLVLLVFFGLHWYQHGTQAQDAVAQSKTWTPPRILLVSALFPLQNSKHSHEEYRTWLANFLGPKGIQCDVYFYTTPVLEELVRSLHASSGRNHTLVINTTYATPFAVPPITPHWARYIQMHDWDRERDIHNPELYAIWNAKPWLLEQAVQHLRRGFNDSEGVTYDYAFWNDAGSFRDVHAFGAWPDPKRVEEVFETASKAARVRKEDMFFVPFWKAPEERDRSWTADKGPVDNDIGEGSFFGSTPTGISWYTRAYYAQHDFYISTAPSPSPPGPPFHFVGKDQTLINALMFRHPERFFGVLGPRRAGELTPPPSSVGSWVAALLRTPPIPSLRVRWSSGGSHRQWDGGERSRYAGGADGSCWGGLGAEKGVRKQVL